MTISLLTPSGDLLAPYDTKVTVVGRSDECDMTIPEQAISSFHGEFIRIGEVWFYRDTGSTNGSSLNGRRLPANLWVPLVSNDKLSLAAYVLNIGGAVQVNGVAFLFEVNKVLSIEHLVTQTPVDGNLMVIEMMPELTVLHTTDRVAAFLSASKSQSFVTVKSADGKIWFEISPALRNSGELTLNGVKLSSSTTYVNDLDELSFRNLFRIILRFDGSFSPNLVRNTALLHGVREHTEIRESISHRPQSSSVNPSVTYDINSVSSSGSMYGITSGMFSMDDPELDKYTPQVSGKFGKTELRVMSDMVDIYADGRRSVSMEMTHEKSFFELNRNLLITAVISFVSWVMSLVGFIVTR